MHAQGQVAVLYLQWQREPVLAFIPDTMEPDCIACQHRSRKEYTKGTDSRACFCLQQLQGKQQQRTQQQYQQQRQRSLGLGFTTSALHRQLTGTQWLDVHPAVGQQGCVDVVGCQDQCFDSSRPVVAPVDQQFPAHQCHTSAGELTPLGLWETADISCAEAAAVDRALQQL